MPLTIEHDQDGRRFVAVVEGEEAVIEYTRPTSTSIELYHTYVPDVGRGQGIAGKLMAAALEYAKAEGLRVVPTCSYAVRYFEKHPEHASLRA